MIKKGNDFKENIFNNFLLSQDYWKKLFRQVT